MTWPTRREVKDLAMRAVRMTLDEGKLYGFSTTPEQQVEKALVDNFDFLYYLVWFAKMDEREACAKVCEDDFGNGALNLADAIRARGQA